MTDATPTVSIVTVVLNGMPFIEDNLRSVAAQTYPAREHWLVDGGSTDGTVDLIRSREATLAGWTSERDAGIADAFNKGLERARGRYIMFLNADDALASPDALTSLMAAAQARDWPDILYGDCDLIDRQSGRFLYRYAHEYDAERFLRFSLPPHPGMLMSRRFFDRYGRFDTSFRIAMDYELQLRAFGAVTPVRAPVVVTRVRTGGESTLDPRKVLDESLKALRMTGHLKSSFTEHRIRAYFALRFGAREALQRLGLYDVFVAARQWLARARAPR